MKRRLKTIFLNIIFYGALYWLLIWMFASIFPHEQDMDILVLSLALLIVVIFVINFFKKYKAK